MSKFAYTSCTSSLSSSWSIRRRIFFASASSSTSTVVFGTIVSSAESTVKPAASTASRTAASSCGSVVTVKVVPSSSTSSAPPSAAASVSSSSSTPSASTSTTPRRSKSHATAPEPPRLPSFFANVCRTSDAVRLLLSFGMEYDFAFSIAFCSARLPDGSPPPSFAATMIARESFEKSLPRFASAAPFLCLIDDHLLCPDTHRLPYLVEKEFVDTRVVGQLRMERGDEDPALARQHRMAVDLGEHLDSRPGLLDPRRPDEDRTHGLLAEA